MICRSGRFAGQEGGKRSAPQLKPPGHSIYPALPPVACSCFPVPLLPIMFRSLDPKRLPQPFLSAVVRVKNVRAGQHLTVLG
jgi:hypothetical protein